MSKDEYLFVCSKTVTHVVRCFCKKELTLCPIKRWRIKKVFSLLTTLRSLKNRHRYCHLRPELKFGDEIG